jgi:murein L,D-transpeptidase YafK
MRLWWGSSVIILVLGVWWSAMAAEPTPESDEEISPGDLQWDGRVPESLVSIGDSRYYSETAFVVDKMHRSLTIWKYSKNGTMERVGIYPIDFGRSLGDKRYLGDHRTPEGIYFFQERYDERTLDFNLYGSRAFTMDYPNFFDRLEGKTGSGIWLHAVPDSISLNRGSRGCVVVRNEVIKNLGQFVTLNRTPILVHNQVNLVGVNQAQEEREEFNNGLNQWRQAWGSKDLDKYIEFYSEQFKASGMNKARWLKYKKGLAKTYKSINIAFSQPTVLRHKDSMIVKALQFYQSDRHSDFGEKTLYLKKVEGQWQIVNEEWNAVRDKALASAMETLSMESRSVAQSIKSTESAHD